MESPLLTDSRDIDLQTMSVFRKQIGFLKDTKYALTNYLWFWYHNLLYLLKKVKNSIDKIPPFITK